MQALETLDLPYLPMEQEGFSADPLPWFEEARSKHPWVARCAFGLVVHEHGAIEDLLRMDQHLCPSFDNIIETMGAQDTPWGRFTEVQLLAHTGDSHRRMRDILAPMFTPAAANRNRPLMRATMQDLLDTWAPRGAFDFEEFISYYPISVLSAMIGAPRADIPRLRSSLEAMGLGFAMDPTHLPALQEAIGILDDFVQDMVARRRAEGERAEPQDLLDDLLFAGKAGKLEDREIYDLLIFMFVAGYDTSKNVMTLTMSMLLERPESYARCAEDLGWCSKIVEEAIRFRNPTMIFRKVAQDIEYRDTVLPAGTMLFFPANVSGHDPRYFDQADDFLPERERKARHIAFGRGMHICLGQFIARAQIEEGLHLIAQRLRNPRLTGEIGYRPFYGVGGLKGLPIAFDT
ncbi:cytochrome P450 [Mangrovimicrobium sediminis]|uniref:Cytochrome P450 n=1 Tax=Mangrovimicrobium sediminis TaxID=2562682 RepID=A0A4Z0MA23_9GAMM|nr:cytochrome P450 [Haliea sp. SAOS-164]TGD76145.1 cytochrome P450 [Haliea sp. SAOS-164]